MKFTVFSGKCAYNCSLSTLFLNSANYIFHNSFERKCIIVAPLFSYDWLLAFNDSYELIFAYIKKIIGEKSIANRLCLCKMLDQIRKRRGAYSCIICEPFDLIIKFCFIFEWLNMMFKSLKWIHWVTKIIVACDFLSSFSGDSPEDDQDFGRIISSIIFFLLYR